MRRRTSSNIPAARPTARGATSHAARYAARYAATVVGVLALGLTLSACGIRDTTIPVDAGEGASRTACPPTPGASPSQSVPGAFPGPGFDGPAPTAPRSEPIRLPTGVPSVVPSVVPSASPSVAQPTTSNGILSCLIPTTTPVPTSTPGAATATP